MTRADPPKCNRCHKRPRAKSQRLCKPCRNAVLAERRAKRRIAIIRASRRRVPMTRVPAR